MQNADDQRWPTWSHATTKSRELPLPLFNNLQGMSPQLFYQHSRKMKDHRFNC